MELNNLKVCLGKCPPCLPTPMAPAAQPALPRTPGASFPSTGGPELGPSCISPLFTTTSDACPPVRDRDPGSAPHCEVQASSHLGPHKRPPRGDCGSFRGTVSCLCCWVSSPALQPHPVLSCRDQGQGPHPGAQSVPTEGLILIRTEFKEDFCIGIGDPGGNRAAEVKKMSPCLRKDPKTLNV